MSSTITEHFTCDRCGKTEDNPEAGLMRPPGWSEVTVEWNEPFRRRLDLCEGCTNIVNAALTL